MLWWSTRPTASRRWFGNQRTTPHYSPHTTHYHTTLQHHAPPHHHTISIFPPHCRNEKATNPRTWLRNPLIFVYSDGFAQIPPTSRRRLLIAIQILDLEPSSRRTCLPNCETRPAQEYLSNATPKDLPKKVWRASIGAPARSWCLSSHLV